MPRAFAARIAGSIEALLEDTTRRIARELRAAVKAIKAETSSDLKRLERRIEKLERQQTRKSSRKVTSTKRTERCKRETCREVALARGLCSRHYQQWRYRKKRRKRTRR